MDPVLTTTGTITPKIRLALESLLADGVLASAVYSASTRSTNSDAISELQQDAIQPSGLPRLYLTDRQTAGRGRQGNSWLSDEDSLTLSLVVDLDRQDSAAALISPAVGVAIAQAIEFSLAPCRVSLKWPNDLCAVFSEEHRGTPELRKLGGVLIETAANVPSRVVVGVGLNLNRAPSLPADRSSAVVSPPMSLAELASRSVDRVSILTAIAESLVDTLKRLPADSKAVVDEYRRRCVLTGRDLSIRHHDDLVTGHCLGITDDGSLEMLLGGKPVQFRSGEVQRVRLS